MKRRSRAVKWEPDIDFTPSRSLASRIATLIAVVTTLFLVVNLTLFYLFLLPSLRKQESMFARKIAYQIRGALQSSLNDLVSLNEDWSNWDAMYRAVEDWTPAFEEEALPQEVFESLDIDYVGVFDGNGHPVYSRELVDAPEGFVLVRIQLEQSLKRTLLDAETEPVTGIFRTPRGPMFFSSEQIVRSDSTGDPRGTLVMGRRIRAHVIDRISELVREKVQIVPLDGYDFVQGESEGMVIGRSGMKLVVVFPVKDYFHRDLFALRVDLERSLFEVLYQSTMISMGTLLVAFLVLIVTVSQGIERIALRRIMNTVRRLQRSHAGKLQLDRIPEEGDDEITLLQRTFNRLLERISYEERVRRDLEQEMRKIERLATAGRVTGNILHEINNPIRVIKNCLFALEKKPEESTETLALLKKEVRQLGHITNQLLDFTRGEHDLTVQRLDLITVLKESILSIETAFPEAADRIELKTESSSVRVGGDRNRLKQVFFNVMKNGLEAMEFDGSLTVEVSVNDENGFVTVTVSDQGPGITPEDLPHLFEPFYSRHKESGVGLGLSVSYDIMKRHGGDIKVDSNEGTGARFRIRIPGEREVENHVAE